MSSAEDFRAKTLAAPGKVRALQDLEAAYGARWRESFAKWDHDTSSWRTHQCLLLGGWESYSETWPRWGWMRVGVCSERVMPERPTSGTGSGLWPTPQTSEAKSDTLNIENHVDKGKQIMLCHAVRMWQTPTVEDAGRTGSADDWGKYENEGQTSGCRLRNQIWATPTASTGGPEPEGKTGRRLVTQVASMDAERGSLNPDWVEWLMGWPVGWTDVGARVTDGALSWDTDPADAGDVPRVAAGVKHRVSRLKAIGNGQAPACAALAWEILSNE